MSKITPFLTFNDQAEQAARFYTSLFKDSRVTDTSPGAGGGVMSVTFELAGRQYIALNGGPSFKFTEGFSLFVSCEDQVEVDALWEKLSEGGSEQRCGWLKDKFGVSWQLIPKGFAQLLFRRRRSSARTARHASHAEDDQARAQRAKKSLRRLKAIAASPPNPRSNWTPPRTPRYASRLLIARVAELADAPDLGSGTARCGGSSPSSCTTEKRFRKSAKSKTFLEQRAQVFRRFFDDIDSEGVGSAFEFLNSGKCS